MARSGVSNLGEVAKSLADAKRKALAHVEKVNRNLASAVLQGVVEGTPEDTSVTVGDWQVGINTVPQGTIDSADPAGAHALARGQSQIATAKLGGTINIVNNQPHVDGLNAGNAVTKPSGWVERSIDAAKAGVR
ncbi:hypothetical protein [Sphingobium sp. UBA5915]|uniref:hypothetical protein n=1 Tax=Sphingobium sp. UBA5915 TaxID=1947530 RepID=UPI0025D0A743|nr:hypothetical protein [Sphingobium sp. UBA5915]